MFDFKIYLIFYNLLLIYSISFTKKKKKKKKKKTNKKIFFFFIIF